MGIGRGAIRIGINNSEALNIRTALQTKLLKLINDPDTQDGINTILLQAMRPYIPTKSGNLKTSGYVTTKSIIWSTPYANYQYKGNVYGPNMPGIDDTGPAWASRRTKRPMGRELGSYSGILMLYPRWIMQGGRRVKYKASTPLPYKFGYTTGGTGHHWDQLMWEHDRQRVQAKITSYLKARARGLKLNG